MKKLSLLLLIGFVLVSGMAESDELYRWVDSNGTIFFSDSPPPSGSFKKQKIEDQIDKMAEKKKDVDKRIDIDDSEKLEEKMKIQLDYEKKAKAIKDYDQMRLELRLLKEKYQKKYDYLDEKWRGGSNRPDLIRERKNLQREYQEEVRKIKEYFGYY